MQKEKHHHFLGEDVGAVAEVNNMTKTKQMGALYAMKIM